MNSFNYSISSSLKLAPGMSYGVWSILRRSRKIKQAKKQLKTRLMDKNEGKNTYLFCKSKEQ